MLLICSVCLCFCILLCFFAFFFAFVLFFLFFLHFFCFFFAFFLLLDLLFIFGCFFVLHFFTFFVYNWEYTLFSNKPIYIFLKKHAAKATMHSARLHAPPRHGRRCHHRRRRLRTLGDGVPAHVQQLAGFQQPGGPLGDDYWGTLNTTWKFMGY